MLLAKNAKSMVYEVRLVIVIAVQDSDYGCTVNLARVAPDSDLAGLDIRQFLLLNIRYTAK